MPVRRHRLAVHAPAALILALLGMATACGGSSGGTPNSSLSEVKPAVLHGALPGAVVHMPSIRLADTNGTVHDLATDARSKVVLLYFGYTHCPDECPTTMADIARGLALSPSWVRKDVEVVFVTTDPKRDTVPVLRHWLNRFSTSFVGLRGSQQQIAAAEHALQLPVATEVAAKPKDKVGAYGVNHFAAALAYNTHGQLEALYPSGISPQDYAADLPVLIADKVKSD